MSDAKDDRPAENLSFAAANLVKPGLSSKRQQSEPPLSRNVFPPTPPPESERSLSGSSAGAGPAAAGQLSRGASVRNGTKPMPAKLNIEKALPPQRYEVREEPPRRQPTTRAASETRGPMRREESRRREPPQPARRRTTDEEEEDEYPAELYDMYRNSRGAKSRSRPQRQYIEEEDEDGSDYDDGSFDENDFEMFSGRPPAPRSRAVSTSGRGASRRPDIRKVRVKVHASEDTRYILIGTAMEYADLVDKIRDKFALRKRFKLKIRDDDMPDGDMITMGDQDDLEMALMSVKTNAKRDRAEMGKMDVSASIHQILRFTADLIPSRRYGSRNYRCRHRKISRRAIERQVFLSPLFIFNIYFLSVLFQRLRHINDLCTCI